MSITITATASNKDAVVSAFEKLGWTTLGTTKESFINNNWELYISIKKGKRTVRMLFWWRRGSTKISDNLDSVLDSYVRKTTSKVPSLELDIDSIDAHYAKLNVNYVKMVEGRNQFKFKKQLVTPYVEGLLMEKGFVRISSQQHSNKSSITNFGLSDYKKAHCTLYLKPLKYAELSEADYDDMVFDLTMPDFFYTGKLLHLIDVACHYVESKKIIDAEVEGHRLKQKETEVQIAKLRQISNDLQNVIHNKRNSIAKLINKKIEEKKNGNCNTTQEQLP